MTENQIPLTTIMQFCDPQTGYLTNEGRTVIQALIDRTGGALGSPVLFAGDQVYGVPTGALVRGTFLSNPALPVGAGYSQAQLSAIRDQLNVLGEHLAALIVDSQAVGVIS